MPIQPQQSQLNPDQAAASLGMATLLMQQMLPQQQGQEQPQTDGQTQDQSIDNPQPQPSQEPQQPVDNQQQTQEPKDEQPDLGAKLSEMELKVTDKLDAIRSEMRDDQKREMDTLKKTITDALK